jgi:hypothetical protein
MGEKQGECKGPRRQVEPAQGELSGGVLLSPSAFSRSRMQGFSKCGVRESRYRAKAVYVAQFDSFPKGHILHGYLCLLSAFQSLCEERDESKVQNSGSSHSAKIKIRHHTQPIILDGYRTHDSRFCLYEYSGRKETAGGQKGRP